MPSGFSLEWFAAMYLFRADANGHQKKTNTPYDSE